MKNNHWIDLRSDTVTMPSPEMRQAMANAEVGDDVYSEDPTVNALQNRVATILGKESALFVPSGCMSNQLAIKAHTDPGDEIICEEDAHIFNYETAAPSILSSVQIKTLAGYRGRLPIARLTSAVRPAAYYLPRTRLICLENTHNRAGGAIYPLDEMRKIATFAHDHNILTHLDGARLWNASVATGISPLEYAAGFDSISVCFSKGLGAPVGSVLAGSALFIERAHKWRKTWGGGMRQAGILAAGALYALEHNIERLKEDHDKAKIFAGILAQSSTIVIDPSTVDTNIVILNTEQTGKQPDEIVRLLKAKNVLVSQAAYNSVRVVTHLDVSMEDVKHSAEILLNLFP